MVKFKVIKRLKTEMGNTLDTYKMKRSLRMVCKVLSELHLCVFQHHEQLADDVLRNKFSEKMHLINK